MEFYKSPKKEYEITQQKYDSIIPHLPLDSQTAQIKFPDGKTFQYPVLNPTLGYPMIDIRKLYQETNHFVFDPGFTSTGSCSSTICYIDGDKGELLYRGYNIVDLAQNSTYMEVCYLLIYGSLPSKSELVKFEEQVVSEMIIHSKLIEFYKGFQSNSHPMAIMMGIVGALSSFLYKKSIEIRDPKVRQEIAIKIVAKMPTLAAFSYRTSQGLPIVLPQKKYSFIENFLYMMMSNPMEEFKIDSRIVRAIDVIFIVHADHEQNASSTTVRIAGSSYTNPYACIAAGIASLWGPSHGGANEAVLKMLEEIGDEKNCPSFIEKAKDKQSQSRLMGFGHRVYKNFDPRATIMQKICYNVLEAVNKQDSQLLKIALQLEQAALKDEYFVKRKLYPNVDFYTGIIYNAIGIPTSMFTVMFAIARSIGWVTQWNEMISDYSVKMCRPRQLYVGHKKREFIKKKDRKVEEHSRIAPIEKLIPLTNLMKL